MGCGNSKNVDDRIVEKQGTNYDDNRSEKLF